MKFRNTLLLSPLLLFLSIAYAQTDILEPPAGQELEEKGQAWTHPPATVSGDGELKIEDSSNSIDLAVEGEISCDVSISAPAGASNKFESESEDGGTDAEAKSDVGDMEVSNCTSQGVAIGESLSLRGAKVKVEIEELRTNAVGDLVFSEYEAEGKVASGENPRVELELENGMFITCPCEGLAARDNVWSVNNTIEWKSWDGARLFSSTTQYHLSAFADGCFLLDKGPPGTDVENISVFIAYDISPEIAARELALCRHTLVRLCQASGLPDCSTQ